MADNPNKKKADGERISQQPHEQAYQKRKAEGKTGAGKNAESKKGKGKVVSLKAYTDKRP